MQLYKTKCSLQDQYTALRGEQEAPVNQSIEDKFYHISQR